MMNSYCANIYYKEDINTTYHGGVFSGITRLWSIIYCHKNNPSKTLKIPICEALTDSRFLYLYEITL